MQKNRDATQRFLRLVAQRGLTAATKRDCKTFLSHPRAGVPHMTCPGERCMASAQQTCVVQAPSPVRARRATVNSSARQSRGKGTINIMEKPALASRRIWREKINRDATQRISTLVVQPLLLCEAALRCEARASAVHAANACVAGKGNMAHSASRGLWSSTNYYRARFSSVKGFAIPAGGMGKILRTPVSLGLPVSFLSFQ